MNTRFQIQRSNLLSQLFAIGAMPDNLACERNFLSAQLGAGFNQERESLFFDEPANRNQLQWFGCRRCPPKEQKIEAVIDPKDFCIGEIVAKHPCAIVADC